MSATVGMGIGASVGMALEENEGEYAAPDVSLTFTQESLKPARPSVESGSITGTRTVDEILDGVKSAAGDIDQELDCVNNGLLLYCVNGSAEGAHEVENLPGAISAAPTATPSAGGSLAPGTYRYKLASVWERDATAGKELFLCPVGAEQSGVAASSELTIGLGWSNPSGQPEGWTLKGTAIYRTAVGGSANTQRYLAYVAAPGTSYNDTGAVTLSTKLPVVPVAAMKQHTFAEAFEIGQNPLPSFSLTVNKDNNKALGYSLCRAGSWELSANGNGNVVTNKFSVMARDWNTVDNFTPAATNRRKSMGWGTTIAADGVFTERFQGFTAKIENGCSLKEGFSGLPRMSDVIYGRRRVTGTLPRDYQDQNYVELMRDAGRFSIDAWFLGGPIVDTDSAVVIGDVIARPIPYMMRVEVPRAVIVEAGGNASGPGQMIEPLNWLAQRDTTEGTDIRISLYNLTASYALA